MNTEIGRRIATLKEEFFEDVKAIDKFEIKDILIVLEYSSRVIIAPTTSKRLQLIDEIHKRVGPYTIKDIQGALGCCSFLLRSIKPEDSREDILDDLREADILNAENESKYKSLVKSLCDTYKDKFRDEKLKVISTQKILKTLLSSDWVVDMRALNRKPFDSEKDDIKTYKPEIKNFVPLLIVSLKIDNDEYVRFQVDEETLRDFHKDVEAMIQDLETAKKLI